MKKLFLVANWKEHKSSLEVHQFMISFLRAELIQYMVGQKDQKKIIICPPTVLLSQMSSLIREYNPKINIELGAQDISQFDEGAHTGEDSARQLSEFVKYAIVGHSERRKEFFETDEILKNKVFAARASHIAPIFCVQGKETYVPEEVTMVAFEPLDAIGSGTPDTPSHANEVAKFFKEEKNIHYVLYGGSVTSKNVLSYTSQKYIDGVLVGGASLDPLEFSKIIQNA